MMYVLADSTGELCDFASTQTLGLFHSWAEQMRGEISKLSEQGYTENLGILAEELSNVDAFDAPEELWPQVEALKQHVKSAQDVLIISDGQNEEEDLLNAAAKRETPVHVAGDRHIKPLTKVVLAAFDRGRKAYKNGGVKSAKGAIHTALLETLPKALLSVLKDAGDAALSMLPKMRRGAEVTVLAGPTLHMKFDESDPLAAKWAREHALELAQGLSDTSEEAIREALALQQETGEDSYDAILEAVGDEARAELIARTESMDAANEGLAQGWAQAQDAGLLTGNELKEWIATPGCCDECDAVDGEQVGLDEDFSVGDDPPLHPNCRCTMGLADAK